MSLVCYATVAHSNTLVRQRREEAAISNSESTSKATQSFIMSKPIESGYYYTISTGYLWDKRCSLWRMWLQLGWWHMFPQDTVRTQSSKMLTKTPRDCRRGQSQAFAWSILYTRAHTFTLKLHIHTHTHTHTHTHAHTHHHTLKTYTLTRTHTYTNIHTHIQTKTHLHMHTRTYIQKDSQQCSFGQSQSWRAIPAMNNCTTIQQHMVDALCTKGRCALDSHCTMSLSPLPITTHVSNT